MSSKEYFNNVAPDWDDLREGFFSETVREKAYLVAGVESGAIAADIGAGTGFITEGLLNKGVKVIAVDQSEAMLEEMRKKFALSENADFRLGDANILPIADGSVNMFLHYVETPLISIEEMIRILKPNGKLVLTDLDKHEFEFLRVEQRLFNKQ